MTIPYVVFLALKYVVPLFPNLSGVPGLQLKASPFRAGMMGESL